jgi:hypothetical protein
MPHGPADDADYVVVSTPGVANDGDDDADQDPNPTNGEGASAGGDHPPQAGASLTATMRQLERHIVSTPLSRPSDPPCAACHLFVPRREIAVRRAASEDAERTLERERKDAVADEKAARERAAREAAWDAEKRERREAEEKKRREIEEAERSLAEVQCFFFFFFFFFFFNFLFLCFF